MILMALDHARQFFTNVRIDPTDPLLSWPALFATIWHNADRCYILSRPKNRGKAV
jgi:hypothetical protein